MIPVVLTLLFQQQQIDA